MLTEARAEGGRVGCTLRSWGPPHRTGPWCSRLGRTQAQRPPSSHQTTRRTYDTERRRVVEEVVKRRESAQVRVRAEPKHQKIIRKIRKSGITFQLYGDIRRKVSHFTGLVNIGCSPDNIKKRGMRWPCTRLKHFNAKRRPTQFNSRTGVRFGGSIAPHDDGDHTAGRDVDVDNVEARLRLYCSRQCASKAHCSPQELILPFPTSEIGDTPEISGMLQMI